MAAPVAAATAPACEQLPRAPLPAPRPGGTAPGAGAAKEPEPHPVPGPAVTPQARPRCSSRPLTRRVPEKAAASGEGRAARESWAAGASGGPALLTVFLPTSPFSLLLCVVLWCSRQNTAPGVVAQRAGLGLRMSVGGVCSAVQPTLGSGLRGGVGRAGAWSPPQPCAPALKEMSSFVGHRDPAESWAVSVLSAASH